MKIEKRIHRILPFCLCVSAILILGIFLAQVIRYEPAWETIETASSVLFADQTMIRTGERSRVEFGIRTTLSADEEFGLYQDDVRVADFTYTGREGDSYLYSAELEIEADAPMIWTFTGKSGNTSSTKLTVRAAPEVTEEMAGVLFAVLEDIDSFLERKYGEAEADEKSVVLVEEFLNSDGRIKNVENLGDSVRFLTTDGLAGMYKLSAEEGVFGGNADGGTVSQDTELIDAIQEKKNFAGVYVYNEYSPTNTRVLLQQLNEKITTIDYHEGFCEEIGGVVEVKRDRTFLISLLGGGWSNYGTVVMNTHGQSRPVEGDQAAIERMKHADGSYRTYLTVYEGSGKDVADVATSENILDDLFADYQDGHAGSKEYFEYSMMFVYTSSNKKEHGIEVSTDYLMDLYQNRQFDNTIFIFDVCYMMLDSTFGQFLLDHGAQAVIGVNYSVDEVRSRKFLNGLSEALTDTKRDHNYLQEAVEKANGALSKKKAYLLWMRTSRSEAVGKYATQFTYRKDSKMKGSVVSADGGAVEGAVVRVARYNAHRLQIYDGLMNYSDAETGEKFSETLYRGDQFKGMIRTDAHGRFETGDVGWGTYIISVETGDDRVLAQVNFHGQDVGDIVLGNNHKDKDENEEISSGEEESEIGNIDPPEPELTDAFMKYVSETLIPQYGVMGTEDVYMEENSGGGNRWDTALICGLLNADIRDYDGDGREEMLVTFWNTSSDGYMGAGLTSLTLWMYECKDTGEIVQTSEKVLYTGGGAGYLAEPFVQTSCFVYDYKGKTYLAVDNYLEFNERLVTLDIYAYDGAELDFVQGIGYQAQGQGDRYVKTLAEEQAYEYSSRVDSMTGCGYDASGWEQVMSYVVDGSSPDTVLSEAEEQEFYRVYCELAGKYGLNVQDWRLWVVQGKDGVNLNGDEYQEWYNQFAKIGAPEVYTAEEGNIHFLCGVLEGRKLGGPAHLYRRDYDGSLDAWR